MEQQQQQILFESRFLDSYVSAPILKDPKTALIELIANCWDAGATRVDITWPDGNGTPLKIQDNGHGMTEEEFYKRWRTLAYDRLKEQGRYAEFPPNVSLPRRRVFGRNGVGRFAAFCFGEEYAVQTKRDGKEIIAKISRGNDVPINIEKIREDFSQEHGTEIRVEHVRPFLLDEEQARVEIGMRFMTDPNFQVYLSGQKVTFDDIPDKHTEKIVIPIDGLEPVIIFIIDTQSTDRTMKQHGIAWHVNGRLVGECSWKGTEHQTFLDGRRVEARRYTFIVIANCLADTGSVLPDWSGFNQSEQNFIQVNKKVQQTIRQYLLQFNAEQRSQTFNEAKKVHHKKLRQMGRLDIEIWSSFVTKVQEDCPSISDRDIVHLAGVLANLEVAQSKFSLIYKLHKLQPGQLDDLHELLDDWSLDMAKIVLDELQVRIKLLDELKAKLSNRNTDEVQELQPLFHRGLWIFGPEFETIEFTSNEGMTTVIRKLFKSNSKGSRNRPDFAILPDSSIGLYSYPTYDEEGAENGVDRLVIVELKKPTITINTDEKAQCWKYIKELYKKGLLDDYSKVTCFVLGTQIDSEEKAPREEKNGAVKIIPLPYQIVLERAKSRLLKLYDKVKEAPFLTRQKIQNFIELDKVVELEQNELDF